MINENIVISLQQEIINIQVARFDFLTWRIVSEVGSEENSLIQQSE